MSQGNPAARLRAVIARIQEKKLKIRQGHDLAILLLVCTGEDRDLERARKAVKIDAKPGDVADAHHRAAYIGGMNKAAANLLFRFSGSSPIETSECALLVLRHLLMALMEDIHQPGIGRGDVNHAFAELRRDQERRKLKHRHF